MPPVRSLLNGRAHKQGHITALPTCTPEAFNKALNPPINIIQVYPAALRTASHIRMHGDRSTPSYPAATTHIVAAEVRLCPIFNWADVDDDNKPESTITITDP
jgi:hypothetical protein